MFYLTMHSTRFIYGYVALDDSDSERGNPLPPHGLLFLTNSKGYFYMHHPTDRIAHTTVFVTPVVEHWQGREIAQWVHSMKDRSDDPSHHEQVLLPQSYISLLPSTAIACIQKVDPLSYFSLQPVLHDWFNKGCGMYYPVCGMVLFRKE